MTDLDLLQEISNKLTTIHNDLSGFNDLTQGVQTLIYIGGVIIALLLVNLFAKNWGRNT